MSTLTDDRIKFDCPFCGNPIKVPPREAGKTGGCNKCGRLVKIPGDDFAELCLSDDDLPDADRVIRNRPRLPQKVDPTECPIAAFYGVIGIILLIAGGLVALLSVLAYADGQSEWSSFVVGLVVGLSALFTSLACHATASLLFDARTTADCSRRILEKLNQNS